MGEGQSTERRINTEDLQALIDSGSPSLKLLDCSLGGEAAENGFKESALPLANYARLSEEWVNKDIKHYVNAWPDDGAIQARVKALGLYKDDTIVCYDQPEKLGACRLWYILTSCGFTNVKVLMGGLKKWGAEGRELVIGKEKVHDAGEEGVVADVAKSLTTIDQIIDILKSKKQGYGFVDSRPKSQYDGTDPEPEGTREGHITGAVNTPIAFFRNTPFWDFKSVEELIEYFKEKEVDPDKHEIVYCRSGIQACVAIFAMVEVGYTNLSLYDGSWSEYGADPRTEDL